MAKDTPSMVKNKMRRCLTAILDPHPSERDKLKLWDFFDSHCAYCGASLSRKARTGHLDHVVPSANGGTNDIHNHVLACARCNGDEKREQPWRAFLRSRSADGASLDQRESRIEEWLACSHSQLQIDAAALEGANAIIEEAMHNFEMSVEQMRALRRNITQHSAQADACDSGRHGSALRREVTVWNREELKTLRDFARDPGYTTRTLPDGTPVKLERWTLRFPPAQPDRLADGVSRKTYTAKPLVAPFNNALFGELAIVQCLERDGWSGVWVDTFHGSELFWRGMPHTSSSIDLSTEPEALEIYRGILAQHGKRGGFFDVLAWRESDFLFVEYKGKGDRANSNESSWIAAALRFGISLEQLLIGEYTDADA